jgi:non-lysosomal glucosylceramidase
MRSYFYIKGTPHKGHVCRRDEFASDWAYKSRRLSGAKSRILQAQDGAKACLGEEEIACKYRALYEDASDKVDKMLWNGEYYIQKLDDVNAYRYQYGIGCLSDQLLGQFMAYSSGLGYVLPKEHVKKALESIDRYNFHRRMDEVHNVQRTYALNDEAALVLCSWPHDGRPRFSFAYCDEVWAGVEYTVAVNMIREGLGNR